MQILHVIRSMNPADGGPPVIAASLAAEQASLGHATSILTYGDDDPAADTAILESLPGGDRVRLEAIRGVGPLERLCAPAAGRAVERAIAGGVDAIHLHNVWDPILLAAAHVARRERVPYAVLLNGMLDPWSLAQRAMKKRIALALGYRRMLSGAAFLHAGNVDEASLIGPLKLPPPVRIIPNGIFASQVDPLPARGTFRATRPALGDRPFVLFLSRLHYKKGLDYLADAFARVAKTHADVQLVVAGPDGGALAPFEAQIAAAGLGRRVHVVGSLYGRAKLEACVDAACFCLPSRQEGFSMAIVEAMACGTPVVISENCHFPEVGTNDAGIVVPLNVDAVAAGIERVVADPAEGRRLGDRGRELILMRYTWTRIAAQTVDLYQNAIDVRSR